MGGGIGTREKWRRDAKGAKVGEDGHAPRAKKWRRDAKGAKRAIPGDMRRRNDKRAPSNRRAGAETAAILVVRCS